MWWPSRDRTQADLKRVQDVPDLWLVISVGSRRRRPLAVRRLLNLVVLLVVVGLLLFVWLQVVRTLTGSVKPQAVVGKPTALAWGGRVFSSQAKLEAWLRERGVSYSVWAKRHRSAVRIVGPTVAAPTRRRTATKHAAASSHLAKKTVRTHASAPKHVAAASTARAPKKVAAAHRIPAKPVKVAAAVNSTSGTGSSASVSGSSGLMNGLLWGMTLLLAAVAAAPRRLVARVRVYPLRPELRTFLGAAAAAFAVGLLLASTAP
jgi:hypothetical protein